MSAGMIGAAVGSTPAGTRPDSPGSVRGRLTVIGMDGVGLPTVAVDAVAEASATGGLIVGGARHLTCTDGVPRAASARRVVLGAVRPAVAEIAHTMSGGGSVVVLASGDPGFFGIVRALREAGLRPRIVPAVSSVAAAFARLGVPWDGAAVVSAHGRSLRRAVNACRALPQVAVLTGPGAGPSDIAAALTCWNRTLVVAERLGTPEESVTTIAPDDAVPDRAWGEPNVVLSLRTATLDLPATPGPRWHNQPATDALSCDDESIGLPEDAYDHRDGMITKSETRAVAVAWLAPALGRLVWDVGAGSGSVGIECARLAAAAVAVERDPAACATIRANSARHGVDVLVTCGDAPEALRGLPDPDAVFVGGGGLSTLAAVTDRRPGRVVVALAALDRVRPAVEVLRSRGYATDGTQLHASRLADLPDGSLRLAATNPVTLLRGVLDAPEAR